MPKMASSADDVFESMGITEKKVSRDTSLDGIHSGERLLIKRCKNVQMINIILRAYACGYSDQQIIALCKSRNFDLDKYLLPENKVDDDDAVFQADVHTENTAQIQTQPKITSITSEGVVRTLQIFCEMKANTTPADVCVKCPHLASISYESMQVVCKYDPTQEMN